VQHLTLGATFELTGDSPSSKSGSNRVVFKFIFDPYHADAEFDQISLAMMRDAVAKHSLCRLLDRRALHGLLKTRQVCQICHEPFVYH
jgi:hypothetical protein